MLRPEVLAAYQELQFTAQTMAAVDVYVKCRWQAEVVEDAFAHVFGDDTEEALLAYSRSFARMKRTVIYTVSSPAVLAQIGKRFLSPEEAAEKQQRALAYWTQHPEDKQSFYEAQDKVIIAVFGEAEDMAVGYYLRDFEGPEYPLSYFCVQKPKAEGALLPPMLDDILFLWREGILQTAE